MKIFCDYCEKSAEIEPEELADWIVTDPASGAQMVMCSSCESRPISGAAELATPSQSGGAVQDDVLSKLHIEKPDEHYELPAAESRLWAFRRCSECKILLEERCVYCDVCGTDVPP